MRVLLLMALAAAPAGAQMVHGSISGPPAAAQANPATTSNTNTAAQTNNQNTVTPTGAPGLPTATTGIPPTPAPAFPGLPVPQASGGLPTGTPPSPLAQDLRTPIALTPSQVADLQTRLAATGFYHGPIDGVLNGATRSGLSAFQQAARLPVTGQPDAATAGAIGISSAARATSTFGTPFPFSQSPDSSFFIQP
jgi:hypothetical protein